MTPAQRARQRVARAEANARLAELKQDLRPDAGKTFTDRRGQAYQVQTDGSIRRVVLAPPAEEMTQPARSIDPQRPAAWQVEIAALCAACTVWSYARGRLNAEWAWWLAQFLTMELGAAIGHVEGGTLSERVWTWFGIQPPRRSRWLRVPIVGGFFAILLAHFITGGVFGWSGGLAVGIAAVPLAVVIAWSLTREAGR